MFEREPHKKTMGCRYLYQVNAVPQGTAPAHNKPKKPGQRPKEGRNGVIEETKKPAMNQ